jgi:Leucine rich repeat
MLGGAPQGAERGGGAGGDLCWAWKVRLTRVGGADVQPGRSPALLVYSSGDNAGDGEKGDICPSPEALRAALSHLLAVEAQSSAVDRGLGRTGYSSSFSRRGRPAGFATSLVGEADSTDDDRGTDDEDDPKSPSFVAVDVSRISVPRSRVLRDLWHMDKLALEAAGAARLEWDRCSRVLIEISFAVQIDTPSLMLSDSGSSFRPAESAGHRALVGSYAGDAFDESVAVPVGSFDSSSFSARLASSLSGSPAGPVEALTSSEHHSPAPESPARPPKFVPKISGDTSFFRLLAAVSRPSSLQEDGLRLRLRHCTGGDAAVLRRASREPWWPHVAALELRESDLCSCALGEVDADTSVWSCAAVLGRLEQLTVFEMSGNVARTHKACSFTDPVYAAKAWESLLRCLPRVRRFRWFQFHDVGETLAAASSASAHMRVSSTQWPALRVLDLSDHRSTIFDFTCERRIDQFPVLSDQMAGLRVLNLGFLNIRSVPAEIGPLTPQLRELCLRNNKIRELPAETLGQCSRLQRLSVQGNRVAKFPDGLLGRLADLVYLNANGNRLTELPADIGSLRSLRQLMLKKNRITAVRPELGECTALQLLDMRGSVPVRLLPVALLKLTSLRQLLIQPAVGLRVGSDAEGWGVADVSVTPRWQEFRVEAIMSALRYGALAWSPDNHSYFSRHVRRSMAVLFLAHQRLSRAPKSPTGATFHLGMLPPELLQVVAKFFVAEPPFTWRVVMDLHDRVRPGRHLSATDPYPGGYSRSVTENTLERGSATRPLLSARTVSQGGKILVGGFAPYFVHLPW